MDERRRDFIRRMMGLAQSEPEAFHGGVSLVERTLQYGGTTFPRVTRKEVEEVVQAEGDQPAGGAAGREETRTADRGHQGPLP